MSERFGPGDLEDLGRSFAAAPVESRFRNRRGTPDSEEGLCQYVVEPVEQVLQVGILDGEGCDFACYSLEGDLRAWRCGDSSDRVQAGPVHSTQVAP